MDEITRFVFYVYIGGAVTVFGMFSVLRGFYHETAWIDVKGTFGEKLFKVGEMATANVSFWFSVVWPFLLAWMLGTTFVSTCHWIFVSLGRNISKLTVKHK